MNRAVPCRFFSQTEAAIHLGQQHYAAIPGDVTTGETNVKFAPLNDKKKRDPAVFL